MHETDGDNKCVLISLFLRIIALKFTVTFTEECKPCEWCLATAVYSLAH